MTRAALAMKDETDGAADPSVVSHQSSPGTDDQWVAVCRLEDIVPNTGVCALVSGEQVAIFRLDGDNLYAISNHDPFSHANVLSRGIVGDLKGEVVVASPVYKQHFSLVTGRCLEDESVGVRTFPVRTEGGAVHVKAEANPPASSDPSP